MGKHIVFLVHGMGTHGDDWADEARVAFEAQYEKYKSVASIYPLADRVHFVPISYDDIFETYLDELRRRAGRLQEWDALGGVMPSGGLTNALMEVATYSPSDNIMITHLGDVLLYMLTEFREKVKNKVHCRMVEALVEGPAYNSWSIVAHSLGTRVINDVMQKWATDPEDRLHESFGKPAFIMMVANVTRLLEKITPNEPGNVYHNAVFPHAENSSKGACNHYITVRHELDPFTYAGPFVAPTPFGAGGEGDPDSLWDITLDKFDLTGINPHAFGHYLRHPRVHRALIRMLTEPNSDGLFDSTEVEQENKAYRVERIQAAINVADLESRMPGDTLQAVELIKKWKAYLEYLQ